MPKPEPPKQPILLQPEQQEWKVEKLVPGGAGFLRLSSGQGAFAPGALPGERIRVELAEDTRYLHYRKAVIDFLYTRQAHVEKLAA